MHICAPSPCSWLLSGLGPSQKLIDSSCVAGLGVNSYSVVGPSGEEELWGDLVWISGRPWGRWQRFGDGGASFSGADEIIMHRVGKAEICTWKSSPFALVASSTIPASHSLYANELSASSSSSSSRESPIRAGESQEDRTGDREGLFCCVLFVFVLFKGVLKRW